MTILKKAHFSRLMNQQTGEGGDAGGGSPSIAPEVQELINKAVGEATAGLKANNTALLNEKKTLQQGLQQFEGIDPVAMKAMMKQFADSEEAGLLAAGKLDEVVSKRVGLMKADYDKQLQARDAALTQAQAKAAKLAAGKVSGALTQAASKTGALPEAMEDIVLRGQGQGWTINDDGDVVALRDGEIVLSKDGKTPLSPTEWAEGLRDAAPHLWPKAQGTGAPGASGGGNGRTITQAAFDALAPKARAAAMAGGMRVV